MSRRQHWVLHQRRRHCSGRRLALTLPMLLLVPRLLLLLLLLTLLRE
jgi:hypothetical protein